MPKSDTCTHRNIQGVFATQLRNFDGCIAQIKRVLTNTAYLVAKNQNRFQSLFELVLMHHYTISYLLKRQYRIAVCL